MNLPKEFIEAFAEYLTFHCYESLDEYDLRQTKEGIFNQLFTDFIFWKLDSHDAADLHSLIQDARTKAREGSTVRIVK